MSTTITNERRCEEFYTIGEVCRRVGRSRKAVYDLIHRGILPAVKLGNEFRVRSLDLDAFLDNLPAV